MSTTRGRLTLGVDNEDVEVFLISTGKKKRDRFVVMMQADLQAIVRDGRLGSGELRTLLLLVSEMDYENKVTAKVKTLGNKLGITPEQYQRNVARLVKAGYAIRGSQVGEAWLVMISPAIASRGSLQKSQMLLTVFKSYQERIVSGKG